MSEERRTWAEEAARRRQRQMEECPPELRPWMERFQEANQAFLKVLSQPNRLRAAITQLEARLAATSDQEKSDALRRDLERLDVRLAEAERVVEEAKVANVAASESYQEARLEWRVREVPEDRRDEARALLREERERIAALYEATPVAGDVYGAAAMEIVRQSALLSKARRTGDQEGAARYEADLTAARERFEELRSPLDQHRQSQKELMDEYERRLRVLAIAT